MARPIVRPYRREDRDAVRRICFATGQLGSPVEHHYRDFESFADIFCGYYIEHEPEYAFVAEQNGTVLGYLVSCLDTRKASLPYTIALKHALLRGVCFRPGTAKFYWRGLWDLAVDLPSTKRPRFDLARFPSHTHNNLLPAGRRQGIATEFYFYAFDALKRAGSRGMHVEVSTENEHMLGFITQRLGYELVGEPYPIPGGRLDDGRRFFMQLALRDLSDWVPGAWLDARKQRELESA